jgi:hypothetical protein
MSSRRSTEYDVGPVLTLLADADIGGYVATPGGQLRHRPRAPVHRLLVDSLPEVAALKTLA